MGLASKAQAKPTHMPVPAALVPLAILRAIGKPDFRSTAKCKCPYILGVYFAECLFQR